ncbi:hypothetical protein EVG20_g5944 [Dentipellis fragilis]|uniref:Uncharacterized protein n=1 Tax=Dentipellis fragilis TaxID=205917 RepID=A0A4Y9YSB9_9AGAM|nr:hypothetical protein EVG20_g5944 [Dentipellis fragilis]
MKPILGTTGKQPGCSESETVQGPSGLGASVCDHPVLPRGRDGPPAAVPPPAAPVPPRPFSSLSLSAGKALQPSASAAVAPKGSLSASPLPPSAAAATGTTFPTALPPGVSIVVPSDFPKLRPESGTGLPLVTTLFSTPAVAFSTIAGSGVDPGPSASAIAQAPVAGKSVEAPAAQATDATPTAKITSAPGGQLEVPSASAAVGYVSFLKDRRPTWCSLLTDMRMSGPETEYAQDCARERP